MWHRDSMNPGHKNDQKGQVKGKRRRKLLAVGAVAVLASQLAFAPAAWAVSFKDVAPNNWVATEQWLSYSVDHGLMSGYKDASGKQTGLFGPEDNISRGQVAVVLYRIANPKSDATTNPAHYAPSTGFKDNGAYPFYRAAVKWLKDMGISTGDRDPQTQKPLNTFRPDASITRQELATLVHRFAAHQGADTSKRISLAAFKDSNQVLPFAKDALAWCGAEQIVTGGKGAAAGKLMPQGQTTRAQAAKIFSVLHRDVLKAGGSENPSEPSNPSEPNKPSEPSNPSTPTEPSVPAEYTNALEQAKDYLAFTHFSRQGLIDQLKYEKFSTEAATYAVEHVGAEWKAQALGKAKDYLGITHFSKESLYDQLTSSYADKFTAEEARYAVEHVGADWNAQALGKAKDYLKSMNFSKQGLYDQLTSSYADKFTAEQAQYAVDNVGADWKAQAAAKAKYYQQNMSLSKEEIRDILVSSYGDKFTAEEVDYAISQL